MRNIAAQHGSVPDPSMCDQHDNYYRQGMFHANEAVRTYIAPTRMTTCEERKQ